MRIGSVTTKEELNWFEIKKYVFIASTREMFDEGLWPRHFPKEMPPLKGRVIGNPSHKTSTTDDVYVWNMQLIIEKDIKAQKKSIVFEKRKKQQNPCTHIILETKPDGQFNTHMEVETASTIT